MACAMSKTQWRPVDIDHNPNWILPFPFNRLEMGTVGDKNIIEAVIRVSNDAQTFDTKVDFAYAWECPKMSDLSFLSGLAMSQNVPF
jgi:hypothetical protein